MRHVCSRFDTTYFHVRYKPRRSTHRPFTILMTSACLPVRECLVEIRQSVPIPYLIIVNA